MKTEIERKFLVTGDAWREQVSESFPCEQGYLSAGSPQVTVRVRRIGDRGVLTLKGPTQGISRTELEYEIPVDEADFMLKNFCGTRIVSKTRHIVEVDGMRWEVDEFSGRNCGLILAEIELPAEEAAFTAPDWSGEEVSSDSRYFNLYLSVNPFTEW